MNPSSFSWFNLVEQEQNSMYINSLLLRMRAHRTPLKLIYIRKVTGTRDFSY